MTIKTSCVIVMLGGCLGSLLDAACDTESCAGRSDDSLLLQRRHRPRRNAAGFLQTLGIGKSEAAMNVLQMTMDLMPGRASEQALSLALAGIDIPQLLAQAGVLRGDNSSHLSGIDKVELEKVKNLIRGLLRDNMKKSHEEDQLEVDADFADLQNCSSNKDTALGQPANASLDAVNRAREMNRQCRSLESPLLSEQATSWELYSSLERTLPGKAPNCPSIPTTLSTMRTYFDPASNPYLKWMNETKALFKDRKQGYETAKRAASDKRQLCDEDQGKFERRFCSHRIYLTSTCSMYDTCYSTRLEKYKATKERVAGAEIQRKEFYKSSEAIVCHLNVILGKNGTDPSTCQSLLTDLSAADYHISYPEEPVKTDCSVSSVEVAPGTDDWISQEYSGEGWPANVQVADIQACADIPTTANQSTAAEATISQASDSSSAATPAAVTTPTPATTPASGAL